MKNNGLWSWLELVQQKRNCSARQSIQLAQTQLVAMRLAIVCKVTHLCLSLSHSLEICPSPIRFTRSPSLLSL
jgi:hypothetical protein